MVSEGVERHCPVSQTDTKKIHVKDLLQVATLEKNLLSVKKLTKEGNTVIFRGDSCIITKGSHLLTKERIMGEVFLLGCSEMVKGAEEKRHINCIHTRHCQLGHRNPEATKRLMQDQHARGIKTDPCSQITQCTSCLKGK